MNKIANDCYYRSAFFHPRSPDTPASGGQFNSDLSD